MKKVSPLLEFDDHAFGRFIKMDPAEQQQQLKDTGVLVDTDEENGLETKLFFTNGFFVEVTSNADSGSITEIIPYRHGYKAESFVEIVQVIIPKNQSA